MSFYPQPNEWTCGPFALKHALIALGRVANGEELAKLAHSHWWSGTDEIRLARAAHAYDCELVGHRVRSPEKARALLQSHLKQKLPVLLCVDDWEHWIVVLARQKDNFVLIDSLLEPVLQVVSWSQLHRRWRYLDLDYDEDEPPELYEMYPLVPRSQHTIRANFSVARTRFLRRPENQALAEHWNDYLDDLLAVCRPRSPNQVARQSMAEFLRRNQKLLLDRVEYWHGDVTRAELVKLLKNYRFVAETYGLVIPGAAARRAIIDMAVLTTMWASAKHGLGEMYGEGV